MRNSIPQSVIDPDRKTAMGVHPVLFAANKSRGNIRLASSDPYDKPLINPNYFLDADDYDI
jgi:hypothetical protein